MEWIELLLRLRETRMPIGQMQACVEAAAAVQ
jgi:hypothetical protein